MKDLRIRRHFSAAADQCDDQEIHVIGRHEGSHDLGCSGCNCCVVVIVVRFSSCQVFVDPFKTRQQL
jgi:hypothetical protein